MHASRKNKRAKQVIIHTCIVSLFTSVSWMFAGAGQNFLPTPWDTIFFFSRFVLDIDVIVFGCMFFIYFKLQRFFKPSTVAIIVAVNLLFYDLTAWYMLQNTDLIASLLSWIISSFTAMIMIMVMSIRYDEKEAS